MKGKNRYRIELNEICSYLTDLEKRKEVFTMSYKELAKNLIDQIPESKMYYIVAYLQGAAVPEEVPNAETLASIEELESGGGTVFTGSTEALFTELYNT